MNWRFWKRSGTSRPRLTFEARADGTIDVTASWPVSDDNDAKHATAKSLSAMVYYVTTGQLLGLVQDAVSAAGRLQGDERLAQFSLQEINEMLAGEGGGGHGAEPDGPVVQPDEVFGGGVR